MAGGYRWRPDRGDDACELRYRGKSKTVHVGSDREAGRQLALFVAEQNADDALVDGATFGEVLDRWLAHVTAKGREENTLRGYRQHAKALKAELGDVECSELTADHLERFYSALTAKGRKATTVARYHASARAALNFAVNRGVILRNESRGTARPPVRKADVDPQTPAQVRAILAAGDAFAKAHGVFLRTVVATWCRRGEVIALRDEAVNLRTGEILVESSVTSVKGGGWLLKDTKSHGRRLITIDADTVAMLKAWRQHREEQAALAGCELVPTSYVFSDHPDGSRPWHPDTGGAIYRRAADTAKVVGHRLQDLRHFGATQALAAGVPITTVSHRLGHAKVTTTLDIYAHWIPATDQLASGLMLELLREPKALPAGRRRRRRPLLAKPATD